MTSSPWSSGILKSRIQDPKKHIRHAGGSPNPKEVATYQRYLPGSAHRALVLGMTPELRVLAATHCESLTSIDYSADAIALYRNWMPSNLQEKETILQSPWAEIPTLARNGLQADVILGDGIFANLPTPASQQGFLELLFQTFPQATLTTRKALICNPGERASWNIHSFIEAFRSGQLDPDEFGFGTRLIGFVENYYDDRSHLLDNLGGFRECDRLAAEGSLTDEELAYINRYRFEGNNCILTTEVWEKLLISSGCTFQKTILSGKIWHPVYPIYAIKGPSHSKGSPLD